MFKFIATRLGHREDSEHQQCFVRFLTGTAWILYILWINTFHPIPPEVFTASWLYIITNALIFSWIVMEPEIHIQRRAFSILVDTFFTSYGMYATGEYGAPLFGALLFITFGYGFRYGNKYLVASASLSIIGISTAMAFTEYWQIHRTLGYGMIFFIIILCTYVSTLISQLQRAINAARSASEAKSQFLANMSHEIRTPLHAVIGMSDLLNRTSLNPEQKDFAATIQMSAKSLLALINDILDISKIEAGKTEINITDFDLHGLINSTAKMLGPEATAKGLAFQTHVAPDVPFLLRGDPQHLKQILINLIHNAIKFTHAGSVKIDVSLLAITPSTARLKFAVLDTGIGIPEKTWPVIFEKFSQADQSDTREYGGTGLGMAIAKQLVGAMGGTIAFTSRENEGSTFWFELELEQQSVLSEENTALPELSNLRILVINPDNDYSRIIENHLLTWGLSVNKARSAEEAIESISASVTENNQYHVIFVFLKYLNADPLQFLHQLTVRSLKKDHNFILIDDRINVSIQEGQALEKEYPYTLDSNPSRLTLFRTLHAQHASHYYCNNNNELPEIAEKPEGYQISVSGLKILVGEDNPTNQQVICKILEHGEHFVTLAGNGEQVLDALEKDNYDLLIIDMHMPIINGIDVVKVFRFTQPDRQHMPIMMLTANATKEVIQSCQDAGFDAYLTKPVEPQKLLSAISSLITTKTRDIPGSDKVQQKIISFSNVHSVPLLDIEILSSVSRVAKSQEFMTRLVDGYIANAGDLIDQIGTAIARKKYGDIADLAHSLHGSSCSIGAAGLAIIADRLSGLVKTENRFMAHTHMKELTLTFSQTQTALTDFLQGRNSAAL